MDVFLKSTKGIKFQITDSLIESKGVHLIWTLFGAELFNMNTFLKLTNGFKISNNRFINGIEVGTLDLTRLDCN